METEETTQTVAEALSQTIPETTSTIPWLMRDNYQDCRIIEVPNESDPTAKPEQKVIEEVKETDFKNFVLVADGRPIGFQVSQMMFALKMLMDVCEKMEKQIDELNKQFKSDDNSISPS